MQHIDFNTFFNIKVEPYIGILKINIYKIFYFPFDQNRIYIICR